MTTTTQASHEQTTTTPRRIYHPIQKDYITFLETSASTGGIRTLAEIELAPGGGNMPHYHRAFDEHFEVLEGELEVLVGAQTHTLRPGDTKTASANTLHCFKNPTDKTTRFLVELRPGSTGFEQALHPRSPRRRCQDEPLDSSHGRPHQTATSCPPGQTPAVRPRDPRALSHQRRQDVGHLARHDAQVVANRRKRGQLARGDAGADPQDITLDPAKGL